MTDSLLSSSTLQNPDASQVGRPRIKGVINRKFGAEIELGRRLAAQAFVPGQSECLHERGWDEARLSIFTARIDELEAAASLAVGRLMARWLDEAGEEEARRTLELALHPIRVGAKRCYREYGQDIMREAFFVNEPHSISLERLLFIAITVYHKLTPSTDGAAAEYTLRGVTAGDIAALKAAHDAYIDAEHDQTRVTQVKEEAHRRTASLFSEVHEMRMDLQLAADQAWPHLDSRNAAIRYAFELPADRPASE